MTAAILSRCSPEWTVCGQSFPMPKKGKQKRPPITFSYSISFPGGLNAEVTRQHAPADYCVLVSGHLKLAPQEDRSSLKDTWHYTLGGCEPSDEEFGDEKAAMLACEQALLSLCESTQTALRARHKG